MKYSIEGGNLPVVKIQLSRGEMLKTQSGAMAWMDEGIEMSTKGGGIGKAFGRLFSGETIFLNEYRASQDGEFTMSTALPGSIIGVQVTPSNPIIIQKGAFLACTEGVDLSVYLQKKISNIFFGGEGLVMQKLEGNGFAWLEIDGSAHEYILQPGQRKIIDTGYLSMMESTCSMEIVQVRGVKNVLFGGEGLFNTVITGPGKIVLQSMPIASFAMALYAHMPHPSSNS